MEDLEITPDVEDYYLHRQFEDQETRDIKTELFHHPSSPSDQAMPVIHQLMKDIPDDDEGDVEKSSEQRLMRVHRNLGHPSNRLLVQILREAKAPRQRH